MTNNTAKQLSDFYICSIISYWKMIFDESNKCQTETSTHHQLLITIARSCIVSYIHHFNELNIHWSTYKYVCVWDHKQINDHKVVCSRHCTVVVYGVTWLTKYRYVWNIHKHTNEAERKRTPVSRSNLTSSICTKPAALTAVFSRKWWPGCSLAALVVNTL